MLLLGIAGCFVFSTVCARGQAQEDPAAPASSSRTEQYLLDAQIFRIDGPFKGDLSRARMTVSGTEVLDSDAPSTEDPGRILTFFTEGTLRIGDDALEVKKEGWFWKGVLPIPFGAGLDQVAGMLGKSISLIASPRLVTLAGMSGTISITSQQRIQYFERVEDDLYRLKYFNGDTGLTLSTSVEPAGPGKLMLRDFTFEQRIVEERKPVEGVVLNVGEPILRARTIRATLEIDTGVSVGILAHPKGSDGLLLIRVRVEPVPEPGSADTRGKKNTKTGWDVPDETKDVPANAE
jgi:hypothetical protein